MFKPLTATVCAAAAQLSGLMLVAPVGVHKHVESLHAALWNRPSGQLATTVVYGSKDPWLATDMEALVAAVPGADTEVFQGATAFADASEPDCGCGFSGAVAHRVPTTWWQSVALGRG